MNRDYKQTSGIRTRLHNRCIGLSVAVSVFFVFMLLACNLSAQNIVPNPSFEQLELFPDPCYGSSTNEDFDEYMVDWYTPNLGTTDIYTVGLPATCRMNLPKSTAPPESWAPLGDQMPRTGNRVIGLKPFIDYRREYAAVKLSCKLVPGKEYYAEMYVSLSEQTNYAQNNIGMYFSENRIFENTYNYLPLEPQIVETNIVSDSINWTKISGTFVADSQAEYLIIGSFASEAESDILYLGNKGDVNFAYYFIDDVLVRPVDPTPAALAVSGDTTLCRGEVLSLIASGAANIKWYTTAGALVDPDSVLSVTPTASTVYEARSVGCNNEGIASKQIVVYIPAQENIGNDTSLCEGSSVLMTASNSSNHQWFLNEQVVGTGRSLLADQAGVYELIARDANNCIVGDSRQIQYYASPSQPDLGTDLYTCITEGTLSLTPEQHIQYRWQDGSTNTFFNYGGPGEYYVTASNNCGISLSDTVNIYLVELFIPNLITANADDKNDVFEIHGGEPGKAALSVFSRFGAAIYVDSTYNNDWKAESVVEGVYYYEYNYPSCEVRKGWLQIIK